MVDGSRPRFSVISAVYDVASYLPEFIEAIENQTFDHAQVEVIMVDDGSSDDSLRLLQEWQERRPETVRVITQANAGQGAARNAGLAAARGEWVTFPDPDDVLRPNYLRAVAGFVSEHPDVAMVATHRLIWTEETGQVKNSHPLRRFFRSDRLVDLLLAETNFHGSAPAAFFRLDQIRAMGLLFDERIRPNFEDGHFCARYLLACDRPIVGFVRSARYLYRKRADQSSSLQGSMTHPGRYTDVFEFGYLAIVDEAVRLHGAVPLWLQHFLCYELLGYLASYESGKVAVIQPGPETDAFHAGVATVLAHCDLDRVLPRVDFLAPRYRRLALQHGFATDRRWVDDRILVDRFDEDLQQVRIRYFFVGERPDERVYDADRVISPRHAKVRTHAYFGRVLLRERIMWVDVSTELRVVLDGSLTTISFDIPADEVTWAWPRKIARWVGSPSPRDVELAQRADPVPTTPEGERAKRLAASKSARKRYRDAWVLMDRIHDAGDSGEVLFRWLRTHRAEINAWFVVEQDTPDWRRLRREFGRRVVAHGSMRWRALMANCSNLLSSHADAPIMRPPEIVEFTRPTWRFTFLQHGVIKDDLSSWLGSKDIDVFVTSTPQERDSIAGDDTSYPFTTKEVQLTGLPRFDRLQEIAARFPADARDLVLVTPTWRQWLVHNLDVGSQRRELGQKVLDSDFVHQWMELVASPDLAEACRRHGVTLGFLPHPNLQALLPQLDLPDHVLALSYDDGDVQELFARTRVLVTDYSSIAFNAAYLGTPVVYFQFDEDLVLTGGHVGRRGYFDYRRDGFGPVTETAAGSVAAIAAALDHGPEPAAPYGERIASTFPQRDGRCCERVVEAVLGTSGGTRA